MKWKFLILSCLLAWFGRDGARGQTTVIQRPDCFLPLGLISTVSAGASVGPFDNRTTGCNTWVLDYSATGFSALSLLVQTASNSTSPPVAWATFTATTGANPNTTITQNTTTFGSSASFFPWVRVQLTSKTGTGSISGVLYGWKTPPLASVSIAANSSVNVSQLGGVSVSDCDQQALFNLSGSGNTQIIAASGTTTIRICHISFSTTAAEDVKLVRGTGANCVTGPTDVTGLYKGVVSMALDFEPWGPLKGAASGAICLNQSAVQALGGLVVYAYVP